jgi:hypothetical protein
MVGLMVHDGHEKPPGGGSKWVALRALRESTRSGRPGQELVHPDGETVGADQGNGEYREQENHDEGEHSPLATFLLRVVYFGWVRVD